VQNSWGRFSAGEIVDWPEHDVKPLLELGYAVVPVDCADVEAAYASRKAADLADTYDLEPEPGLGSGLNGAYTIADLRDIIGGEEE
jgi:hypothetical protein